MKKITAVLLIAALMLTALSGCLPVDGESERGAGMAPEGEVSREAGPAEEPEVTRDPNVYDPVVSSAFCSDHERLYESIIDYGVDVPQECWWIDAEKASEVFGFGGSICAGCRDGVVNFELSPMNLYVTLTPREEPIEMSWHEELVWEPMDGHDGYEQAKTENGVVFLRWQREEYQFGAKVLCDSIDRSLDKFLENSDQLWNKVKLREPGATPKPMEDGDKIVASVCEDGSLAAGAPVELEGPFPCWERAGERVDIEGVTMELSSMEDVHNDEPAEEEPYYDWKRLNVKLTIEKDLEWADPFFWRMDYLQEGEWYTVYRPWDPEMRPAGHVHGAYSKGEKTKTFYVPAQALWRDGKYRVCHDDLGTFEFTIAIIE